MTVIDLRSSRRSVQPLHNLALLIGVACLVFSCAEAAAPEPGDELNRLRPGESLLDRPELLEVVQLAPSNLPAGLSDQAAGVLGPRTLILTADQWVALPIDADRAALPARWREVPELGHWACQPALRLDLALGPTWLRHEGAALAPVSTTKHREVDMARLTSWVSANDEHDFRWDPRTGILHVFGRRAPGELEYGYRRLAQDFRALIETPGTALAANAEELVTRLTLKTQDRVALYAPAPSIFERRVQLDGDVLHVAAGLPALGFADTKGRLTRDDGLSDGVRFAVELVDEAGSARRVWSRVVTSAEGFIEAQIDLSAHRGEALIVRLLTEPGAAENAVADYAAWADLRVMGPTTRAPERPHIVLIDIDTLRADRLGTYGAERDTSPQLDAWAREQAVVYENPLAAAAWTLPSTASILTGMSVTQHGVAGFPSVLTPEMAPLAMRLKAAGYETLARVDGGFLSPAFGFQHGFDLYDFATYPHAVHDERGWSRELARVKQRSSERPLFYLLQTYMVHAPHKIDRRFETASPPYSGTYAERAMTRAHLESLVRQGEALPDASDQAFIRDLYDAGVRRMDELLHTFLAGAAEAFGDEPYVVVITSDHGEELFEHGNFGHGHSLRHDQLFVPLIIRYPRARPGRESRPVSSLDIVPTVLELVGLPIEEHLPGRSLVRRPPERRVLIAEQKQAAAVRLEDWTFYSGQVPAEAIYDPGGERLYDQPADPWSREELGAQHPQIATDLARQLEAYRTQYHARHQSSDSGPEIHAEVIADLRALGYLGGDG